MRMRGRLRDSARAAHRRHLLIRHVEAGSVKLSGRAGVIGMASSPTKPCRRNPSGRTGGFSRSSHKLPHRAREIAGNRPSHGQTPNKNVGNPRFKKNTPETQNGRTPTNQCIRDKLPHKSGTSPHTIPWLHKLPRQTGTSSPTSPSLPKPPEIRAARKRPISPMPLRPAQTQQKTAHPSGHAVDARLNCRGRHRRSTRKRHAGSPPRHGHGHGFTGTPR